MLQLLTLKLSAPTLPKTLARCLGYHISLGLVSVVLMQLVDLMVTNYFGLKAIMSTKLKSIQLLEELGILYGVALVTFFGPLVEEIAFRLALTTNKLAIISSLSTLVFFLSGPVFYIDDTLAYLVRVVSSGLFGVVVYWFIHPENTEAFFKRHQNYLLVITSTLFAGVHISNFHPIQYEIIFLYPIYVLPQFFMGLILGWLRIQYGFLWAVLFHVLVNGLFTWPKALLMLWNS